VGLLVVWTEYTSWRQLTRLRQHFGAVQIDSFHYAEHLKATVLGLDRLLLRFDARENPEDRALFREQSRTLAEWIARNKENPTTSRERDILTRIEQTFADYRQQAEGLMAHSIQQPGPQLWEVFEAIQQASSTVLHLADELAVAHRDALNVFVTDAHQSIVWLHRLLLVSLLLLVALGGALTLLVYRGIVAPMRTQLVESHAIIERQEKLSALGVLAAGVAHEIRSPLTAVKVRLHSLNRAIRNDASAREDATVISEEVARLERILRDFLQFARPSEPEFSIAGADALLREIHDLMKVPLANNNIELRLETQSRDSVRVDPQQLKQVFLNLVQNAADSIEGPGTITLRSRAASVPLRGRPTPVVILEVSDTGKGIPPGVQQRLFDPFFSTKESGTGLGLSIAARIVEKHGGALQYQTQVDRGTTFGIVLPKAAPDESKDSHH
jgi:signal transduction histidine kinase